MTSRSDQTSGDRAGRPETKARRPRFKGGPEAGASRESVVVDASELDVAFHHVDELGADVERIAFGKHERGEAEMDMTPMVDVTFLLLIFFMVTAAFSLQKSLQVPTPRPDEASANVQPRDPSEDPDTVTVHVDENDMFRVVTTDWDVEAPSRQELLIRLREASQGNSRGRRPTKLLVMANVEASHGNVITAMDVGSDVGMEQVQLMIVEENE
jgi:biopolymer transport protein ExbD